VVDPIVVELEIEYTSLFRNPREGELKKKHRLLCKEQEQEQEQEQRKRSNGRDDHMHRLAALTFCPSPLSQPHISKPLYTLMTD
jgi:hypothetical protein